jgi:hypothetical protein
MIPEDSPTGTLRDEAQHLGGFAVAGCPTDEHPAPHFAVLILTIDESTRHLQSPLGRVFHQWPDLGNSSINRKERLAGRGEILGYALQLVAGLAKV